MKKKPVIVTIPEVRAAPARAVERRPSRGVGYPTAAELVSSSAEWKRWLDTAMRAVLRPAAVAGAVGLAASACATGEGVLPDLGALVADEAPPPPDGNAGKNDGVVMYPMPPSLPSGTGAGGGVTRPPETHPPHPTQVGGSGDVVATALPDPPPANGPPVVGPDTKPPVVLPTIRPHTLRGGLRPVHPRPDIPMPGGIRPVLD
jgi:hypothetical protein